MVRNKGQCPKKTANKVQCPKAMINNGILRKCKLIACLKAA